MKRQIQMLPAAFAVSLLLAWVSHAGAVHAQVNADVLRPEQMKEGWSGGLDGSFSLFKGNVELLELGGAARLQYQTFHPASPVPAGQAPELPFVAHRTFITANGRFSERGSTRIISQAFAHVRWTGMWHKRVGSVVFAQYQYNEFLRLQGRGVLGVGVGVNMVQERMFTLFGVAGYLFEYTRVNVVPGAPDDPETFENRVTNALTARLALFGGQLLMQNTIYFQPRISDVSDYRLMEEVEVLARVSTLLALGATFSVAHDSDPPTGVEATDIRLINTVRLSF